MGAGVVLRLVALDGPATWEKYSGTAGTGGTDELNCCRSEVWNEATDGISLREPAKLIIEGRGVSPETGWCCGNGVETECTGTSSDICWDGAIEAVSA
jgi:hypothetical protein